MKIIRLTTFLDFGGVEKRLTNVASVEDSNEWVFCAINKGGQAEKEILEKGKQVHCLNLSYKIPNPATVYSLYRFFKSHKPDVVHTSGAEANFFGIIAANLAGVPRIIAEEIGIPGQGKLSKIIFSTLYKRVDYVVGNSQPVLKYLANMNKVSNEKLKLIANPIILKDLPQPKSKYEEFIIISVSRLEHVKNIEGTLRVLRRLLNKGFNVCYHIVGSGKEEIKLKALAKELKLEDKVKFLGFQTDPYPFLLESDVYVINSFTEGFSNSLIEAMYSGIPSVSTKSGSAEEIITPGVNGWLVNVDDDDDLFATLVKIIELDKEERELVAKKAKLHIKQNYSLESHIQNLMKLYN
ncbi:glycosyltransferase [Weeksellaceae bacterium KMM 9724]|uniref:glycosyltransferase n=1 Tax=Profundicola chukchiensis TaxID=2961959 RepID=UPI00243FC5AF|nr:glycosyltransferase [Profundicola chukchiensis]MDG4949871.1 glycosyltransferase [Profundicola chukchiensis]